LRRTFFSPGTPPTPELHAQTDRWSLLNPEYTYRLYTDEDMDTFVNETYPGPIAESYNRLNIVVARVDFWRYLVLYEYGGVYVDMDMAADTADYPLRDLIRDEDDAIVTAEGNAGLYVQLALIFRKKHPILQKTIELIVDNIRENRFPNNIHAMTGPTVYSWAINHIHFLNYGTGIDHSTITADTDVTYIAPDGFTYRLDGIDYKNKWIRYSSTEIKSLMYTNKKHWRQEEEEKLPRKEHESM